MTADCDIVSCSCCANCHAGATDSTGTVNTAAAPTQSRISTINKLIGSVSPDISKPGSPQNTALNWILYGDDQKLTVNDTTIIQRFVLAVFYYSLGGDSWATTSSWLTPKSECDFSGIVCNEYGVVTTIAMGKFSMQRGRQQHKHTPHSYICLFSSGQHNNTVNSGLQGTLPPEMGLLDDIEVLELSNNQISGVIPVQLSELDSLQSLFLHDNQFVGAVSSPICELRRSTLREFKTDCDGANPLVSCACCTNCEPGMSTDFTTTAKTKAPISGKDTSSTSSSSSSSKGVPSSTAAISTGASIHTMRIDYEKQFGSRGKKIAEVLEGVSPDEIYKTGSFRAAAAEWIIKEDKMAISYNDPGLPQRWILALLYFALDGANWTHQDWLTPDSECSWYSVVCNSEGRVTSINLVETGLLGLVPDELAGLTKLETLDLHGNRLEGKVPEDLCDEKEISSDSLTTLIFDCMEPPLVDCDCCSPCVGSSTGGAAATGAVTSATNINVDGSRLDYLALFGQRGQNIAQVLSGVSDHVYLGGSSCSAAVEWIIKKDKMQLEYTDKNLIQRFVLAMMYYHLDGPNWIYKNFLTDVSECEWDQIACNENGEVISITLSKFLILQFFDNVCTVYRVRL